MLDIQPSAFCMRKKKKFGSVSLTFVLLNLCVTQRLFGVGYELASPKGLFECNSVFFDSNEPDFDNFNFEENVFSPQPGSLAVLFPEAYSDLKDLIRYSSDYRILFPGAIPPTFSNRDIFDSLLNLRLDYGAALMDHLDKFKEKTAAAGAFRKLIAHYASVLNFSAGKTDENVAWYQNLSRQRLRELDSHPMMDSPFGASRSLANQLTHFGREFRARNAELRVALSVKDFIGYGVRVESLRKFVPDFRTIRLLALTKDLRHVEIDVLWWVRKNPKKYLLGVGEVKSSNDTLKIINRDGSTWMNILSGYEKTKKVFEFYKIPFQYHVFLLGGVTSAAKKALEDMGIVVVAEVKEK